MSRSSAGQAPEIPDARIRYATAAFLGYTALMMVLERRLRRTGGPGIIPFELARTPARADSIMTRWGPRGRRTARTSLWLDFGYMATYGVLAGLLVDRARRVLGHPPTPVLLVVGAVAGDAIEGVSLLNVLSGNQIAVHTRRAHLAASIKFALLAAAGGYVATAWLSDSRTMPVRGIRLPRPPAAPRTSPTRRWWSTR
ncbi:hypothetical protein AB0K11_15420 [Mycobacterium sp. NPDC050551]|uniref:hypothetical protein n=1 Tax=Mycobacterium sp. NPDC050551 TaxID=3155407 RepID=UPI003432B1A2